MRPPAGATEAGSEPVDATRGLQRRARSRRLAGSPVAEPVSAAAALELVRPHLHLRPVLVVSDFDGTLSRIVLDPWSATILPLARRALRALAARPGVSVAILSGRTAADVATRVRVGGVRYRGNHGLERADLRRRQRAESLAVSFHPVVATYSEASERLAAGVQERIVEPWLVVERKPPTVAFHYRTAPDVDAAAAQVLAAVDALDPEGRFVRFPGRRVLELRPPGAIAKGEAMAELIAETAPALTFMLGDDRSDALAFAVLRAARDAGQTHGFALAVQARAEAPPEVAAAADVVLGSPRDAARFLAGLARLLQPA